MFTNNQFENSRSDGFAVLEVAETSPKAPRQFIPLRRTELAGDIIGPLADLRLTQVFGYSAAQCDKTLEALYRFPLPGDAAVTGVAAVFGDVEIRADLKERAQAEADYEQAKARGQQAALATRESPDVFTLRVAGLQPDQEIRVETTYVQLARMDSGEWSLRIPLTTSPRYVREDEANSRHASGQPLALLRDPGHRFSLDLRFPDAATVTSSTHPLAAAAEEGALRVRLEAGEVIPDRDCVLRWRAAQESQHPALHLHLYEDRSDKMVYFLALIAPPSDRAAQEAVARESVLLVDHSGSMHGPKWEAADWAVKQFLNGLTPKDSFSLGLFHDDVTWFSDRPRRADAGTVSAAIAFLEKHKDSGGTNLGVALEQALAQKREVGEASRHILVLTDVEVSDGGRILRLAETESARADRRRISVLCIDAAPNSLLARELAERGGGISAFLTSEPDQEDISTALDRILEDWAAPVMAGLRLEVNRPGAQAVGRATLQASRAGGSAIDVGDLPAGRALWIAGRVPRGESADLSFRLMAANGREVAARRCDLAAGSAATGVKALFGASRVLALEYLTTAYYQEDDLRLQLQRLGYDANAYENKSDRATVYAENTQQNALEGLRPLLAREALRYGLASSETAFVAVRQEAGKIVEDTAIVANALPSGWSDDFEYASYSLAAPTQAPNYYSGAPQAGSAMMLSSYMSAGATPHSPPVAPSAGDAARGIVVPTGSATPPSASAGPPQPGQFDTNSPAARSGGGILGAAAGLFKRASSQPASQQSRSGGAGVRNSVMAESVTSVKEQTGPLYAGAPVFTGREAVLFDTSRAEDAQRLGPNVTLTRLILGFTSVLTDASALDSGLAIVIYIDDLASPRARVRLADLMKQSGIRPLNLKRTGGQAVRIVLDDPNGVWSGGAPALEVRLE